MKTRSSFSFFVCVLLALFCFSCTTTRQQARIPSLGEEKLAWHAFVVRSQQVESSTGPYRITATFRYKLPDVSSTRVSALLWGNGRITTPYPLRLDLSAGLGTTVANIQETDQQFLAYSPEEKTAYHHPGKSSLLAFGVPVPFSLGDLSFILTGRAGKLFLPADASADTPPEYSGYTENGVLFTVQNAPLPGVLELAANGAILSWEGLAGNRWRIEFTTETTSPLLPIRVRISHPKGYEAIVTVKDLTKRQQPFTTQQMSLVVPSGTKRQELNQPNP